MNLEPLSLESLGWSEFFADAFAAYAHGKYIPARVASENRGLYLLCAESGDLQGEVTGRLRYKAEARGDLPAVGDWVVVEARFEEGRGLIRAILPRQSKFSRKVAGFTSDEQIVAANISTVFLVTALNRDFNVGRMERYLIMTWESGANPVIVLNKADLCPDVTAYLDQLEHIAAGVPMIVTSCTSGDGLDGLKPYLGKGATVALLGSSGVGKSTLVNCLLGEEVLLTQATRAGDDRGRHTTTTRDLILLPTGGMVIDTPGMREMQLWGGEEELDGAFSDIDSLSQDCRFTDCRHAGEPGSAVAQAIEDGHLDARRLESYRKLQRELAYLAARQEQKAAAIEKNRWKSRSKAARNLSKR